MDTRARMVDGAARLVGSRGVEASSLRDLAREAGVPLGSTYHHFPGGKEQLVREAVLTQGRHVEALVSAARAAGAQAALEAFVEEWRLLLERTDYATGCAVFAAATAREDAVREAARSVLASWQESLAGLLVEYGVSAERAGRLGLTIVVAVEGAVALSRAERSVVPLAEVATELAAMIEAAADARR